jgi:geranylgeranyl pyrophosphate synthase
MGNSSAHAAADIPALASYKQAINADIAVYAAHARAVTREQYGAAAGQVTNAFLDVLEGDGKRIRGALVMTGYEMLGGQDRQMIVRAATALEMIHTYMLIVDDIQDRSPLRRGKPAVHTLLAKSSLAHGDSHIGVSLALNAALSGGHAAQMLLAGLNADPDDVRKVLGIVNHTMVVTSHGQTYDLLYSQPGAHPDEAQLERVLHWKTAEYTFLNPLCVGMVLTGAGCDDTNAIRDYALHAGKAFQLADDLRGVFGTESENGKDIREDIREGKRTLLVAYALRHAAKEDQSFLEAQLGNIDLTPRDFDRCRQIMESSGARAHVEALRDRYVAVAVQALDTVDRPWRQAQVQFLQNLAQHM